MRLNDFVTAGVDINGKDHNTGEWIVPGWGGGLMLDSDMSHRVCQIRNGVVTKGVKNPASYSRPMTRRTFTVPFEVSGEIFLISRMADPFIIGENRKPTWNWSPNFHPVFVDEDNNIVTGLSEENNRWSASGQIDKAYGIKAVERFKANMNHDAQLGVWHRWRMRVPEVGVHEVWWGGELVYRVVEKDPPAAWWGRPMHAALRLDFYDYKLKFDPFRPYQQNAEPLMELSAPLSLQRLSEPERVLDTRDTRSTPLVAQQDYRFALPQEFRDIPGLAAVVANVVTVEPQGPGWLAAWPEGGYPGTSSINYAVGSATANEILLGVDSAGRYKIRTSSPCHVVIDVAAVATTSPNESSTHE
jgi:hypothetical protein